MENYKWLLGIIFGGGGLGVVVFQYFFRRKYKSKEIIMTQRSGKNSTNIQVGRDFKVDDGKMNDKK